MLLVLRIENLALVDSLTWELGPGLVGVTGETGAGKSIIVGALKLLLGERTDRSIVRNGTECCSVEGVFQLTDPVAVDKRLEEAGLPLCEDGQLVVRRQITANGPNKQFINCVPATLGVLKSIGLHLVDLHGPHAHQSLVSQERQLQMLDAFAGCGKERESYSLAHRRWRDLEREKREFEEESGLDQQQIDLLKHQIAEIREANFTPKEEPELLRQFQVASNGVRLRENCAQLLDLLGSSNRGVLDQLREAQRLVRDLEDLDPQVRDWTREFDAAQVELEDIEQSLSRYAEAVDLDPAELRRLEDRVDLLETLKRKYGGTLEAVLEHADRVEKNLARTDDREGLMRKMREECEAAHEATLKAGRLLSRKRKTAAPRLAKVICKHLAALGFKQARMEVDLPPADSAGPHGLEQADFIFAPNPGEPPQPLRLIASSGEMSRVMLAVKSALAREDRVPLLVFDEIDANVGGEIALAVGSKMAELGKNHQVISITHLPQVAALADSHFLVEKNVSGGRTISRLREVADEKRVEEIARMLGGSSDSARLHAKTLLN